MLSFSKRFFFILIFLSSLLYAKNPITSPTFNDIIKELIQEQKYVFDDENVKVYVPQFADNPTQVPILVDGKKITDAKELIIFADLNPIPLVINMKLEQFLPIASFNIKVAQETPLRVMVKDKNGLWHIGSANIKSFGGGCSVASTATNDKNFELLLGKAKSQLVKSGDTYRLKFNIYHPMETGLTFGATEFYIKEIKIYNDKNELLTSILSTSAISENPNFLFETKANSSYFHISLLDTDFNEYKIDLGNSMRIFIFLVFYLSFLFSKDFDYHLKPIKITNNSYYFYGKKEYFSIENGSNIVNTAFIITKNSVIVIDTGSSYAYAKQMIQEIKKITNNPIKFVINTHHHPDHFLGNNAFENVKIYATKFTTDDIEKNAESYIENLSNISLDAINGTKGKAPNALLKDNYLDLDGYKLKILYLKGHTEDDIAIYDENTKVLYPSDLVFYDRTAATPHSDIKDWINSLQILRKIDYKFILPGHGELSTSKAPIDETISYLTFVDELFKSSAKKGLNVYEVLNQDIPKKFKNLKMFDEEFQRSTINLYPKYEQKAFK